MREETADQMHEILFGGNLCFRQWYFEGMKG